jgi:hypothetical protein
VEEDVRRVGPALQAAIIGGIAGGVAGGFFTILGVLTGLFGERRPRHRGDILCRSEDRALSYWDPELRGNVPFDRSTHAHKEPLERGELALYRCTIKLFNETEVETGLRDVAVVLAPSHRRVVGSPKECA